MEIEVPGGTWKMGAGQETFRSVPCVVFEFLKWEGKYNQMNFLMAVWEVLVVSSKLLQ